MNTLITTFNLPPGFLTSAQIRDLLVLIFSDFKWFTPAQYGSIMPDQKLPVGGLPIDKLVEFYAQKQRLSLDGQPRGSWLSILPDRRDQESYYGSVTWAIPAKQAGNNKWRQSHIEQSLTVMKLLNSPLAFSALEEEEERKFNRWVTDAQNPNITRSVSTIRGYNQGLAGLFWRNFYGPTFSQMFGERLNNLPQDSTQDLGVDYWLIEPYTLPSDTETDTGRDRENELIERLGPECFYDFETNTLPTTRPDLPELEQDE